MATHLVGYARIYAFTITWRWLPPAAIRRRRCWRCISPPRGSGVNITWRHGRPLLSPAIYRVCMPRWRTGIPLWVEEADDFTASVERLADFCQQHQVSHLFYNYQYEFNERQRDCRR
ncbi:Deoxyribodipyrimidine photolyase [Klebsiella pneumoniae]|uniref:Deoxyribodipyrimidine photolyase n=1 Tax=Klebsiella pneumoniae TaxID=573 RepID=A0A377W4I9_KLEPN|nr:Deoxyribodipyrimidine photolyase [Klebsiella pneumoniae]